MISPLAYVDPSAKAGRVVILRFVNVTWYWKK